MPNWTQSMQQTFEFYTVDPNTWKNVKPLRNVKSCSISRDSDIETLGSASFEMDEPIGESYIRVYLVTNQNGVTEKHPLGTFLVQTPVTSFDGKQQGVTVDAYTPLIELKEKQPELGYYVPKDSEDIMNLAYRLVRENARAPVVKPPESIKLQSNFVSDTSDTWLTFLTAFIANAKYSFSLDEMGNILFAPNQHTAALQPVWTFDDGNSSILYPEYTMNHDLYGIPNAVEVVYSGDEGSIRGYAENTDPNSPISIPSRGRTIKRRILDPSGLGNPTQQQVQEYAETLLKELSTIEYTISFTHGYVPVQIGDCVRLKYSRSGFGDVKAKIISQSIKCEPGCPVSTKAAFTSKLWG